MVKNKTRQKPVNAWVSLCLVTKRLANWGELLSDRPLVRTQPGVPKAPLQAIFAGLQRFLLSFLLNSFAVLPERFYTFSAVSLLIGFEHFSGFANENHGFANTGFPNYNFRNERPPWAAQPPPVASQTPSG